jgi:hypothetical protein
MVAPRFGFTVFDGDQCHSDVNFECRLTYLDIIELGTEAGVEIEVVSSPGLPERFCEGSEFSLKQGSQVIGWRKSISKIVVRTF